MSDSVDPSMQTLLAALREQDPKMLVSAVYAVVERTDALESALRDIAAYPVGDNGYADIARAALARRS